MIFEKIIKDEGQVLLGWRDVPVENKSVGPVAKTGEPDMKQVFIGRGAQTVSSEMFNWKLLVIRKMVEKRVRESDLPNKKFFYITHCFCF